MKKCLPERAENTMGKGEITLYEQFLLFPQCFQKTCTADTLRHKNKGLFGKGLSLFFQSSVSCNTFETGTLIIDSCKTLMMPGFGGGDGYYATMSLDTWVACMIQCEDAIGCDAAEFDPENNICKMYKKETLQVVIASENTRLLQKSCQGMIVYFR